MIINVNGLRITVTEDYLEVVEGTLYNTKAKKREGLDGDIVTFCKKVGDRNMEYRGRVNGYTCGSTIYLSGVDKPFEDVTDVKFIHMYSVTDSNTDIEEEITLD